MRDTMRFFDFFFFWLTGLIESRGGRNKTGRSWYRIPHVWKYWCIHAAGDVGRSYVQGRGEKDVGIGKPTVGDEGAHARSARRATATVSPKPTAALCRQWY